MGRHYNAGYLAAVAAGTFSIRGVMQRVPPWSYPLDSPVGMSWWTGVCDAVADSYRAHLLQGR